MANKADGEFQCVVPVDSTCAPPYYTAISTTAATTASLPAGAYWVRIEGASVVLLRTGGTAAAIPASGNVAAGTSGTVFALAHGETYVHATAGTASVIAHASGHLWLQPVATPG